MLDAGRTVLGIDKPCVIQQMAVTNLCVSSVPIKERGYSFTPSVSFALFKEVKTLCL